MICTRGIFFLKKIKNEREIVMVEWRMEIENEDRGDQMNDKYVFG